MISHSNKKGFLQIDFFFVTLVFLILFGIVYSAHQSYSNYYDRVSEQQFLQITAQDICSFLISQSGNPNDWQNVSNTHFYGLKQTNGSSLDEKKIDAFFNSSQYSTVVDTFGITGVLYFDLSYLNASSSLHTLGSSSQTTKQSGYAQCFSTYNGDAVKLTVEVWR